MGKFFWERRDLILTFGLLGISLWTALSSLNQEFPRNRLARLGWSLMLPFQRAASGAVHTVASTADYLHRRRVDRRQLEVLARENARLRIERQRTLETESENRRLRRMLQYSQAQNHRLVMARVIGWDPSQETAGCTVDRGAADGVAVNQAAVTPDGVVGRVTETWPRAARLLLITDPRSRIGCLIGPARVRGITQGAAPSPECAVKYVSRLHPVKLGDLVWTSGWGSVDVPGLVIGRVGRMSSRKSDLFQDIQVFPSADLTRLHEVFIITQGDS